MAPFAGARWSPVGPHRKSALGLWTSGPISQITPWGTCTSPRRQAAGTVPRAWRRRRAARSRSEPFRSSPADRIPSASHPVSSRRSAAGGIRGPLPRRTARPAPAVVAPPAPRGIGPASTDNSQIKKSIVEKTKIFLGSPCEAICYRELEGRSRWATRHRLWWPRRADPRAVGVFSRALHPNPLAVGRTLSQRRSHNHPDQWILRALTNHMIINVDDALDVVKPRYSGVA